MKAYSFFTKNANEVYQSEYIPWNLRSFWHQLNLILGFLVLMVALFQYN